MNNNTIFSVLLVDDDDVACESVCRSFKKHDLPFPIVIAHDGLEALQILRDQHAVKYLDQPYIILLDLNMPGMNGFEFLSELRSDPSIASSVVFVLTTSNDDQDRAKAYDEQIAGFMVKSAVGRQFSKLTSLLSNYSSTVILPELRVEKI